LYNLSFLHGFAQQPFFLFVHSVICVYLLPVGVRAPFASGKATSSSDSFLAETHRFFPGTFHLLDFRSTISSMASVFLSVNFHFFFMSIRFLIKFLF